MKRNKWNWVLKAIAACITALCILSLFCVFYYNPPVHVAQPNGATSYTREPNRFWSRMSEGVAHGHTDENGYNNVLPLEKEHPDILMIGSSQTEGLYVNQDECVSYLLNQRFQEDGSGWYVYNIGMSAHDTARTLQNLVPALETYQPQKYVVFETSALTVDPAYIEMGLQGELEDLSYVEPGTFTYYVQSNPLVKLLYQQYSNFRETKAKEKQEQQDLDKDVEADQESMTPAERAQIDRFDYGDAIWNISCVYLSYLSENCHSRGCRPVVFYIPTLMIMDDGTPVSRSTEETREMYARLCEERDIIFVDMTDAAIESYEKDQIILTGFANTSVGYGHLNREGHRILSDLLYEAIAEQEVTP